MADGIRNNDDAQSNFNPSAHVRQLRSRGGQSSDYLDVLPRKTRKDKGVPKSPEHRQKISEALRRYATSPDSHLRSMVKRGADHPNFTTGINAGYYRDLAFRSYGRGCNRCARVRNADGEPLYLVVHHRDEVRTNNDVSNLEVLCMSCHLKHHRGKR